jgi:hypothetical protein
MTERVNAEVNKNSDHDVVNWPFKVTFWRLYHQWITTVKHELTLGGRMKIISLLTVCEGILET